MTLDNLAVGLIGAVVGSILGVAGAFGMQSWQSRRDDRAAIRIVHWEVFANIRGLEKAMQDGVYAPLSASAWIAGRHRLAQRLSPDDFFNVARYFANIEAIQGQGYPMSGGGSGALKEAAKLPHSLSEKMLTILAKKGWSAHQREMLVRTVRKPRD
jgi:hypothetical protein